MTCRKRRYVSRRIAKKVVRRMMLRHHDRGLDVYECPDGCAPGTWHVGHSFRKRVSA